MKKCEYCGKEISYHEQYCSDDCQIGANKYYDLTGKLAKLTYAITMICVIGIPVGLFLMSFAKLLGVLIAAISCAVLGILLIALPTATEGMIKKNGIKKSVNRIRLFGLLVMLMGGLIVGLLTVFVN